MIQSDAISVKSNANQFAAFNLTNFPSNQMQMKFCSIQFDEISVKTNANQFAAFNLTKFPSNQTQINLQYQILSVIAKKWGFEGKIGLMIGYILGRTFGGNGRIFSIRPKPIFHVSVVHQYVYIDGLSPLCMNVPFPFSVIQLHLQKSKATSFTFSVFWFAIKKANLTLENEKPLKGSLNFKGILVDRFHVVIHELEFG